MLHTESALTDAYETNSRFNKIRKMNHKKQMFNKYTKTIYLKDSDYDINIDFEKARRNFPQKY